MGHRAHAKANAATIALTGTLLGIFVDRRFLALPVAVTAFLLQHAVQGWCPPVATVLMSRPKLGQAALLMLLRPWPLTSTLACLCSHQAARSDEQAFELRIAWMAFSRLC